MEPLVIVGAANIAKIICEPEDNIKRLAEAKELKAWKEGPGRGSWRALPEDLVDFVRRKRDKYLQ